MSETPLARAVPMPPDDDEPDPIEWPSGTEGVYLYDPESTTFDD